MPLDKGFFETMIAAAKQEQDSLRTKFLRQEGVVAFCEMLIKKLEEEAHGNS